MLKNLVINMVKEINPELKEKINKKQMNNWQQKIEKAKKSNYADKVWEDFEIEIVKKN